MTIESLYEAVEDQNLVQASTIFEEEMKDRIKSIVESRRAVIGASVLVEGEEPEEDEDEEDEDVLEEESGELDVEECEELPEELLDVAGETAFSAANNTGRLATNACC